jgi:hypothetical protein
VQIPQGTHQWLAAHTPFLMTAPPESGTFTATTRVHGAVPAYDNFGGVVAYVSSTDEVEVEGEHSNGGATPEDDGAFGHVGGVFMNFGVANKPARETRELTLHRKAVSVTTSTYDFSDGDGPVDSDVDVPLIPVDQSPGIFAGNTGGAFDLYFEWLQVCTP